MATESDLDPAQRHQLARAVDQILPAGSDHPGGWAGGVESFIDAEWNGLLSWSHEPVRRALTALADGVGIDDLAADQFAALRRITHEGFYGAPHLDRPPGWDLVGFAPLPEGVEAVEPAPLPTVTLTAADPQYDTVVIGSGTGGGVVAAMLADHGERVLLVERSRAHSSLELRDDHLRGKRAAVYAPTAGPADSELRVQSVSGGRERQVGPADGRWGLNAMTVGGGTRLWQAQAWRFLPDDFRMASVYGVPDGSTLVDWPFGYEDMEPWYERAEAEVGVSGDTDFLRQYRSQATEFPMPALPGNARGDALGAAATRLGWRSGQLSFAINSVPRHGRAACVQCQQCVGHACPVDAKAGSHNTVLRDAMSAGRGPDLLTEARAVRIDRNGRRATAVAVVAAGQERSIGCGRVVVAAGAAETPRLLLWSELANDHVGRHLQAHNYTLAWGRHEQRFGAWDGPGHSVATLDFNHHNPGVIGGGVLHDGTQFLPVAVASMLAPMFTGAGHGPTHTEFMREGVHHIVSTMACGQEIPSETARVDLHPTVRDDLGVPVVRFSGSPHPADDDVHRFLTARGVEWLEELGCAPIVDIGEAARAARARGGVTAGEHGAGTCRMGDDPARAATDRWGRVHGTENVYVADASLHPTNAGLNPGFTVLANAFRIADHLVAE
ncbi:MAG: GMC family oxidoreductase [Acidimicrobiia bacterium]|nr:GMC family oxidoreductase [Acidimicrobiia bacterium]MDH5236022.1 GMC family oxidoreductase [Acidimicrobiia bacterium]